MDDIFTQCREGNAVAVRLWLDNTENDLNQGWAKVHLFVRSHLEDVIQNSHIAYEMEVKINSTKLLNAMSK